MIIKDINFIKSYNNCSMGFYYLIFRNNKLLKILLNKYNFASIFMNLKENNYILLFFIGPINLSFFQLPN